MVTPVDPPGVVLSHLQAVRDAQQVTDLDCWHGGALECTAVNRPHRVHWAASPGTAAGHTW